ncbi:MAG: hotdog fold thioesterase [Bacteroidaceae bacterium]|nr:hotdog fold thioesterase [Bacteroidaceae bacterium]
MLNAKLKGTMIEALGIKFLPSDDDFAMAEMPIGPATRQYFGILHGGASLALAETLAGAGSLHLINYDNNKKVCGVQVSGNHISMSAHEGKVYGRGTVIHCGRTSHIWNIDVIGEDGKLLSTERVENRILD